MIKLLWLVLFVVSAVAALVAVTTLFQWLLGHLFKPRGLRNLLVAVALLVAVGVWLGWSPEADHPAPGQEVSDPQLLAKEQALAERFVQLQQRKLRLIHGAGPLPRDVHGTIDSCHGGEFQVSADLPGELTAGLFRHRGRRFPALVRFSFAQRHSAADPDFLGAAIKLRQVPGEKLETDSRAPDSHDFLLVSSPVFPFSTVDQVVALAQWRLLRLRMKGVTGWEVPESLWDLPFFILPRHWQALSITLRSRAAHPDPLRDKFWSQVPYRLGAASSVAVKYHLRPCAAADCETGSGAPVMEFMVQKQLDPERTPIENPSIEWRQRDAPFRRVALLTFADPDRLATAVCNDAAFSPWHSLADHRPLGNMNRVRRHVYRTMSRFRRD